MAGTEAVAGGRARSGSAAWVGNVLDNLRGLRWPARKAVSPGAPGAHRSKRRGMAVEFTEYRPYRPGDEPRRIDWKLLARTDRAYIRLTDDHAILPTTISVDASASMAYPVNTLAKWKLAEALAVGFAAVANNGGDSVGVMISAGDRLLAEIPRTTRRGIINNIITVIDKLAPGANIQAPKMPVRPPIRGRLVVISDFLQEDDGALERAKVITASGGEVYAIHVVAHEELDPPRRALLVTDPENTDLRRPLVKDTRTAYLETFAAWRAELQRSWQSAGAYYTMATTDETADRVIRRAVRP